MHSSILQLISKIFNPVIKVMRQKKNINIIEEKSPMSYKYNQKRKFWPARKKHCLKRIQTRHKCRAKIKIEREIMKNLTQVMFIKKRNGIGKRECILNKNH